MSTLNQSDILSQLQKADSFFKRSQGSFKKEGPSYNTASFGGAATTYHQRKRHTTARAAAAAQINAAGQENRVNSQKQSLIMANVASSQTLTGGSSARKGKVIRAKIGGPNHFTDQTVSPNAAEYMLFSTSNELGTTTSNSMSKSIVKGAGYGPSTTYKQYRASA